MMKELPINNGMTSYEAGNRAAINRLIRKDKARDLQLSQIIEDLEIDCNVDVGHDTTS